MNKLLIFFFLISINIFAQNNCNIQKATNSNLINFVNILENVKLKSSINNRDINENIIKQLECLNEELKFGNKNEKPYSLVNYMSYNKNFYAIYFKTYDSTGVLHRYIFFDVKRNKIKNYYLIDSTNKIIKQEEFIKVLKTYI